jgi:hypothetical protein
VGKEEGSRAKMSYHWGVPPPQHYTKFYDPASPYDSGEYVYHLPNEPIQTTPAKRHVRKASYSTPKAAGWYSPPGDSPPYYDAHVEYATPRKNVYVSTRDERQSRYDGYQHPNTKYHVRPERKQTQPVRIYDDDAGYAEPHYIHRTPTKKAKYFGKAAANTQSYYEQDQIYQEQPRRATTTRIRRSSTTTKKPSLHKSKPSYTAPVANEQDAARASIPAGYSIKNWDPSERPIILLGSVFDANSLGKWIYDWTVYKYTASHPFADEAGEMWLLLIKLAGKIRRAEECLPRIRNRDNLELVDDFLQSAERLWAGFKTLLKDCEFYMLKAAKREGSKKMGKNAGTEFVDSIFGRDRYLDDTERLMQKIRTWNMRFDANCEEILRRPSAA